MAAGTGLRGSTQMPLAALQALMRANGRGAGSGWSATHVHHLATRVTMIDQSSELESETRLRGLQTHHCCSVSGW